MYESTNQQYMSIPNNPLLTRIFFDKMSVRVGKGLLSAIKEVKENPEKYKNIHGRPYLSMIARYGHTNKRTTMKILAEMEKGKILKSKLIRYKIGSKQELVRSYELLVDIDSLKWLEDIAME